MTAIAPDLPKVYLKPGELHFAATPAVVTTVLGSCVSVTMFDRLSGTAAICHALLPEGPRSDAFRYVDSSILLMLEMFAAQGVSRQRLEVKVFGGADIIGAGGNRVGVGRRNVEIATLVLAANGLTVAAKDVGGTRGRKLFFVTHTGEVFLKRLRRGGGAE
ncbi:CheD [Geobacter metallireducens RCH3]|uniref:Probable chemoreceptor glutamine deamidase CheD n=1 Tax=Geobacter metallireducens (strain ATCC 53774 / DSM 7210 / GS-15) TaxID=269799 RepID=Q39SY0_GEOMG|nr:chemotaxis protein CheD [Geobacter metallireducens]ABB32644.1 protein glutamine deamidase and protein glutamate methylesterase CheD associated with MCPs of class 34H [Geobacter metallireducens GS-15]EHP87863.1 CheD [Geobacter metallireducens RCH3]